jgi:hypothetical protein
VKKGSSGNLRTFEVFKGDFLAGFLARLGHYCVVVLRLNHLSAFGYSACLIGIQSSIQKQNMLSFLAEGVIGGLLFCHPKLDDSELMEMFRLAVAKADGKLETPLKRWSGGLFTRFHIRGESSRVVMLRVAAKWVPPFGLSGK